MNINDNSLCNIDFSDKVTRKAVQEYILALFESGVDTVELDYKSAHFLDGVNTSNRFIYRVEQMSELMYLLIAKRKNYAYVCIPLSMLHEAKILKEKMYKVQEEKKAKDNNEAEEALIINYLIEVDGSGKTADELLSICKAVRDSECASIIRIVKSFNTDTHELSDFIDRYYDETNIPLDICPLNTELNGVSAAYEAFGKEVNMITLSFGSSYMYTPYEMFVLYFPPTLGLSPAMVFTSYLYVAAARFNAVSDSPNQGLKNLNNIIDSSKKGIVNVDAARKETVPRRFAVPKPKIESTYTNVQREFCDINGVDSEIGKELSDALDNFDMSLYNRFLLKGEFEQ